MLISFSRSALKRWPPWNSEGSTSHLYGIEFWGPGLTKNQMKIRISSWRGFVGEKERDELTETWRKADSSQWIKPFHWEFSRSEWRSSRVENLKDWQTWSREKRSGRRIRLTRSTQDVLQTPQQTYYAGRTWRRMFIQLSINMEDKELDTSESQDGSVLFKRRAVWLSLFNDHWWQCLVSNKNCIVSAISNQNWATQAKAKLKSW